METDYYAKFVLARCHPDQLFQDTDFIIPRNVTVDTVNC